MARRGRRRSPGRAPVPAGERPRRVDDARRTIDRTIVDLLVGAAIEQPSRIEATSTHLFESLLPLALKQEWSTVANVILQVDGDTADLPWEMLADRKAGGRPFIRESGLVPPVPAAPERGCARSPRSPPARS